MLLGCLALLPGLATLVLAGCEDPVRQAAIDALGPEAPNVPKGKNHRPGQPCLLCHDDTGGANPVFSLAGTVYVDKMGAKPLGQVSVNFVDSDKRTYKTQSNCAGNFYVRPGQFAPHYPVWVSMTYADKEPIAMESPIFREGSCAGCHADPVSAKSAGHTYMFFDVNDYVPVACK